MVGDCCPTTRLPLGDDPANFLSDAWLTDHPRHRWTIADGRAEERESKGDL